MTARNVLATLAVVVAFATSARAQRVYELGGMYTFHYHDGRYADWGDYALHGARIAIEEINTSGMIGEDRVRLGPENTVDYHCWPEHAAAMTETLMQKGILVLTGADCSGPAVEMARVGERHGIPVISSGANASELSSAEEFPYFVRVVTPSEAYEGYLVDVAAHFGIDRIAYFHTTDAWGMGARRVIRDYANRRGIRIAHEFGFARDTAYEILEAEVRRARDDGLRHVVMTGPTPDTVAVFRAFDALGMNVAGASFYAAEMISADEAPEAVAGSLGYFAPMTQLLPSERLSRLRSALEARLGRPVDPDSKAFFYGALSYDHMLAVGYAIRDLQRRGVEVTPGHMMEALRRMDFEGATGRVALVPGTNDRARMPVQIFNSHGYGDDGSTVKFVPVGSVDPETGQLVLDEERILWPGGVRSPPDTR